ncbi:MAG: transglutaminase-like domain-containing protein [Bacteroidota bacterium]
MYVKNFNLSKRAYPLLGLLLVIPLMVFLPGFLIEMDPANRNVLQAEVSFSYHIAGDQPYQIESFIPFSSSRQHIRDLAQDKGPAGTIEISSLYQKIKWEGKADTSLTLSHRCHFTGKRKSYPIDPSLKLSGQIGSQDRRYLKESAFVQAYHPLMTLGVRKLIGHENSIKRILQELFSYLHELPNIQGHEGDDALETLSQLKGSPWGKSRLLIAMTRNLGIPSRLVGGMILQKDRPNQVHVWTEVKVGKQWIPIDPFYGHFASLPANYMELFRGEHFLITHNPGLEVSFSFSTHAPESQEVVMTVIKEK